MALTTRHNSIRNALNGAANSVAEMSRELEHSRLDTENIRAAMEESERWCEFGGLALRERWEVVVVV
jgi:hypothetical protein